MLDAWFVAPWIAFAGWWAFRARGNAEVARCEARISRLSHGGLFAAGAALLAFADRLPWPRLWPFSTGLAIAALALEWGGVAFAIWAREHLGRMWSGTVTVKKDHQLVKSGPYRFARHPIYTGLLACVVGTALVQGRAAALLAVPLFAAGFARKIALEERFMLATFGDRYREYRRETRALIPFVL